MEYLKSIPAVLREWLPALLTLLVGIVVISTVYRILMKRQTPTSGSRISQQLLLAVLGGVFPLASAGRCLSVPAWWGFITLCGVAVLNGVVMVGYFNQLRQSGLSIQDSVKKGAERRLRPVLMTAMIASFGLLPLLAATGPGSELQQPLAVVVIGGLFTSTILTLILLPALYAWVEEALERRALSKIPQKKTEEAA